MDLPINGTTRKALIQTSKIGWGVVLDRANGQFIQSFKTAYDNIITGWSASGRPSFNPAVIPAAKDVDSGKVFEVCPHFHGARNLQSPSFSPMTSLYYLGINNSCMDVTFITQKYELGQAYQGMKLERAKLGARLRLYRRVRGVRSRQRRKPPMGIPHRKRCRDDCVRPGDGRRRRVRRNSRPLLVRPRQ